MIKLEVQRTSDIMIKSLAKKLHLPNEVVSKAMEYQRLATVRCSDLLKQYSDNCICVICLQLAASHSLGIQFDKVMHLSILCPTTPLPGNVGDRVEI